MPYFVPRESVSRIRNTLVCTAVAVSTFAGSSLCSAEFQNFESPPVHPIELSNDGTQLWAVHTADNRLVVFDLTSGSTPVRTQEIQVGVEPVTVRQRTATEVWVVNHISDSVSIVDLATASIVATLLVGDEPTDVVFAGSPEKAFVCVSQEDLVRVYDTSDLTLPPVDIPLEMSDPISLALSPDGGTLYVAALDSQNNTTAIPFADVEAGGGLPVPSPPMAGDLPSPPRTALIVQHNGSSWLDELSNSWDAFLGYTLLDNDVIRVSTSSLSVVGSYRKVGTSLFNVAVNPIDGRLYVSNLEAFNQIRFEPNLKGRFVENRVTVIDPLSGVVTPKHLNNHIDYASPDGDAGERAASLSFPVGVEVSADGTEVFVAAFGSGQVGVLDADGNLVRRIAVGEGPAGLAYDESENLLYVWNRFDSSISVVNLTDDSSVTVSLGFDPTPTDVLAGRILFYSGENSSAHGDLSCASCHIFGGMDNISWDLGDPQGEFIPPSSQFLNGYHPMKGPMTTQSLKELEGTQPLHWRGDRSELIDFNAAFVSLLGRDAELSAGEFADFEAFVLSLSYPPSPLRDLDGSLPSPPSGPDPSHGEQLYTSGNLVGNNQCVDCHSLPTGENGAVIPAQLLDALSRLEQDMGVPQLRNMYEKTRFDNTATTNVRGFGFTHDGAVDDLFSFLESSEFTFGSDSDREDVAAFLLAFDTGTPPAVGAQWTMDGTNETEGLARVQTLLDRAVTGDLGVVAKGRDLTGEMRGWMFDSPTWVPDRDQEAVASTSDLLDLAAFGTEISFTAVTFGCERRLGVDRDLDGFLDRDEIDAGSDPGNPLSTPATADVDNAPSPTRRLLLESVGAHPALDLGRFAFELPASGPLSVVVHDVNGRVVRRLMDRKNHSAGRSEATWDLRADDGADVPAGVYFVHLLSDDGSASTRLVVRR